MADYFVEVLYTSHNVGVGSGYVAPLGHAGFIAVNGNSGQATYYDYGRYSGTDGIVRTLDLGKFAVGSSTDIYNSVLAKSNNLLAFGSAKTFAASVYEIESGGYGILESFYSALVGDPNGYYGTWDPWFSCYGITTDAAGKVGVSLPWGFMPTTVALDMLAENGGMQVMADGRVIPVGIDIAPRCFPAATSVMMADGTARAIKDIKVGDVVMAYNPTPGFVSRRVGGMK